MLGTGRKDLDMVKVYFTTPMAQSTKENGRKILKKDLEFSPLKMEQLMRDLFRMIECLIDLLQESQISMLIL